MIFTTQLSGELYAFNDNIIVFEPSSGTPVKCTITIEGVSVEITPNPSGVFTYNFKSLIVPLINENKFIDTITPDLTQAMVYLDTTLFKDVAVTFTIQMDNLTEEIYTHTYSFLKAVQQHDEFLTSRIKPSVYPLLPFTPEQAHATYYEGQPFEVSVFSSSETTLTLYNQTNERTLTLELTRGVNRIFFSDGERNTTLYDNFYLVLGVNKIYFRTAEFEFRVDITKKDQSGVTAFKWFNNQGGFSYFGMCHRITDQRKKGKKLLKQPETNFQDTTAEYLTYDNSVNEEMAFLASGVSKEEKVILNSLAYSPIIYRNLSSAHQLPKWVVESLSTSRVQTFSTRANTYELLLKINNNPKHLMKL